MLTGTYERPHAHGLYGILEIASVFSLVIIVNLLLGLTYKLTFVAGVCAEENVQCVYGSALPAVSHIRGGAWNASSPTGENHLGWEDIFLIPRYGLYHRKSRLELLETGVTVGEKDLVCHILNLDFKQLDTINVT